MSSNPVFSFVSPVYLGRNTVVDLVDEIGKVMKLIDKTYEVILVDDRSPDNSWEVLKKIANTNDNIKCVRLSRNFGQHPAIMAGLELSKGEIVCVLDCDLQDKPSEVVKLYSKLNEGYDVVLARRKQRNDVYLKRLSSYVFARIFGFFTNSAYDHEVANFGLYRQKVVRSVLNISDYIKYFPLFVDFVGFKVAKVEVSHAKREEGKSGYSFLKLLKLAFNIIISFSNKPLKLFVSFGLFTSFIALLFGIYNIYLSLTGQIDVLGYSSLIVSIWFLSGIIITVVGITGIYVGKMFDQTKNRPVYIIDETLNLE